MSSSSNMSGCAKVLCPSTYYMNGLTTPVSKAQMLHIHIMGHTTFVQKTVLRKLQRYKGRMSHYVDVQHLSFRYQRT